MSEQTLALPGIETPPMSYRLDGNVWGIDPSTKRIALAILQGRGRSAPPELGTFSLEVPANLAGAARLEWIDAHLPAWLAPMLGAAPPSLVLVEQPFGQGDARPHPQSYFVVGVLLLGLQKATRGDVHVDTTQPSTWKKVAIGAGRGFAKKREILAWAQSQGYPGRCPLCDAREGKDECKPHRAHDEADAVGIVTDAAARWLG